MQFPPHFLWGTAISSYQTEGNNFNSDWYLWEKENKLEEAGGACSHYSLFRNDFQLARRLNLNSLRLSIEWARVYPDKFTVLEGEIQHYKEVLDALREFNLKPSVTLHHFTNPVWFSNDDGWLSSRNIDFFLAYLRNVVEALKEKVELWIIFNEPLVYIYNSFVCGIWPPGRKSLRDSVKVLRNMVDAYVTGYQEIKQIYKSSSLEPKVSIAKHMRVFSPCSEFNFGLNSFSSFLRDKGFNFFLLQHLKKRGCLDYVGLNYYCKEYVKFKGLIGDECGHSFHKERRNHINWYVYPQGLYEILIKLKQLDLPVIITENGTAESEDRLYLDYLISHLESVGRAIQDGVDVRGYFWWSLLDNFEWDKGFKYRFGLTEVDYNTFDRKLRPFAKVYAEICGSNSLDTRY
jgi:beta-glucosidase